MICAVCGKPATCTIDIGYRSIPCCGSVWCTAKINRIRKGK